MSFLKILITTPNYLLEHDMMSERTRVLESGYGEYYGLSWHSSGEHFVHSFSGIDNTSLLDLESYANSEKGGLFLNGSRTWSFLSQPHQILWVDDDYILITNSGRNALTRFSLNDHGVKNYRYDDILWDRLTAKGTEGSHYNSLYKIGNRIFLVAHNFGKGSFILELNWPFLEQVSDPIKVSASGIHNLWVTDDNQWFVLNSHMGSLVEVFEDKVVWSNNFQGLVRGLAASGNMVIIGHSEQHLKRENRATSGSGLWVIDKQFWKTLDFIPLGRYGCVHDVRIYNQPDDCHHGRILNPNVFSGLKGDSIFCSTDYRDSERNSIRQEMLKSVSQPCIYKINHWTVSVASKAPIIETDTEMITMPQESFLISTLKGIEKKKNVRVFAKLHLLTQNTGSHASLIARYLGPGDNNMCAALFQYFDDALNISLWETQGKWFEICRTELSLNEYRFKKISYNKKGVGQFIFPICFVVYESNVSVQIDSITQLEGRLIQPVTEGKVGIRLLGNSLGFSGVQANRSYANN
jgi:hypothetical protein